MRLSRPICVGPCQKTPTKVSRHATHCISNLDSEKYDIAMANYVTIKNKLPFKLCVIIRHYPYLVSSTFIIPNNFEGANLFPQFTLSPDYILSIYWLRKYAINHIYNISIMLGSWKS